MFVADSAVTADRSTQPSACGALVTFPPPDSGSGPDMRSDQQHPQRHGQHQNNPSAGSTRRAIVSALIRYPGPMVTPYVAIRSSWAGSFGTRKWR